jgi:hypothetical protein
MVAAEAAEAVAKEQLAGHSALSVNFAQRSQVKL